MHPKALLATDIDNTLTDQRHLIPDEVVLYLSNLYKTGWEIVFLTGRTFSFAEMSMKKFDIPYFLATQNGAEVIRMPQKEVINQNFISKDILYDLEIIYQDRADDFLIYSGFETGDFCYFRPSKFSPEKHLYLEKLIPISTGDWKEIKSFDEVQEKFPLVKCIGDKEEMATIRKELLERRSDLNVILMSDAVDPTLSILLITHMQASKGIALRRLYELNGWECPIIGAGDGNNDISLFSECDIKIAMENGSPELIALADIIAKPSDQNGIIEALEKVTL